MKCLYEKPRLLMVCFELVRSFDCDRSMMSDRTYKMAQRIERKL